MTQTAVRPVAVSVPVLPQPLVASLPELLPILRGRIRANPRSVSRQTFLLYAFLRGVPHEKVEPRVSEHNVVLLDKPLRVPDMSWHLMDILYGDKWCQTYALHKIRDAYAAEMKPWCVISEDRVKRFEVPRKPRNRPTGGRKAES